MFGSEPSLEMSWWGMEYQKIGAFEVSMDDDGMQRVQVADAQSCMPKDCHP